MIRPGECADDDRTEVIETPIYGTREHVSSGTPRSPAVTYTLLLCFTCITPSPRGGRMLAAWPGEMPPEEMEEVKAEHVAAWHTPHPVVACLCGRPLAHPMHT